MPLLLARRRKRKGSHRQAQDSRTRRPPGARAQKAARRASNDHARPGRRQGRHAGPADHRGGPRARRDDLIIFIRCDAEPGERRLVLSGRTRPEREWRGGPLVEGEVRLARPGRWARVEPGLRERRCCESKGPRRLRPPRCSVRLRGRRFPKQYIGKHGCCRTVNERVKMDVTGRRRAVETSLGRPLCCSRHEFKRRRVGARRPQWQCINGRRLGPGPAPISRLG